MKILIIELKDQTDFSLKNKNLLKVLYYYIKFKQGY